MVKLCTCDEPHEPHLYVYPGGLQGDLIISTSFTDLAIKFGYCFAHKLP